MPYAQLGWHESQLGRMMQATGDAKRVNAACRGIIGDEEGRVLLSGGRTTSAGRCPLAQAAMPPSPYKATGI